MSKDLPKRPRGAQPGHTTSESTRKLIGDARRGSVNPNRMPVSVLGVKYAHVKDAALALNIPCGTVRTRIRATTDMWREWYYL